MGNHPGDETARGDRAYLDAVGANETAGGTTVDTIRPADGTRRHDARAGTHRRSLNLHWRGAEEILTERVLSFGDVPRATTRASLRSAGVFGRNLGAFRSDVHEEVTSCRKVPTRLPTQPPDGSRRVCVPSKRVFVIVHEDPMTQAGNTGSGWRVTAWHSRRQISEKFGHRLRTYGVLVTRKRPIWGFRDVKKLTTFKSIACSGRRRRSPRWATPSVASRSSCSGTS